MLSNAFNQRILAFAQNAVCANGQPVTVTGYNVDINENICLIKGTIDIVGGATAVSTTWNVSGVNTKHGPDYNLSHFYTPSDLQTAVTAAEAASTTEPAPSAA